MGNYQSKKKGKNIIVLNDLRSIPIVSVVKLKKTISGSKIVAHESIFKNKEYADHTVKVWKYFLKFILSMFFGVKIIKKINKELSEQEKMGFYSSLLSIVEDTSATAEKYPQIYAQAMNIALGSKDVVNYIKEVEANVVFIFNGRTASSYLISKYCVVNRVNIFYYEYAGHDNGFRLFPVAPHASGRLGALLLPYYKNGVYNNRSLEAAADIIRYQKLNSIYKKRTNQQVSKKYDVAIFLGSDFEYTAVDPQICEVTWLGNPNFCKSVIEKYGQGLQYVIRCHPNSALDPNWPELFRELQSSVQALNVSVDIIPPDSPVDSHDLIRNCSQVVTDLSTISLDSILLGKPTDIFGNTDIRYIYTNSWFVENSKGNIASEIIKPFALGHNFLVFRFNMVEKVISNIIFLIHETFSKLNKIKKQVWFKTS